MSRLLSRRTFLITGAAIGGTAAAAALVGIGYLSTIDVDGLTGFVDGDRAVLNAFVVIHDDGRVVVNVPKTEMGQGIHTGLAMVVAEELDIPFDDRISVEFPVEPLPAYSTWFNLLQVRPEEASGPVVWLGRRVLGQLGFIATGASGSTMGMWHPMRVAGAAARQMLLAAGSARLGVPVAQLTTGDGFVRHVASGRSLSYGELAREAAVLPPPREPELKPAAEWRLIGKSQPRVDLPAKVRGEPVFGMDVVLPDMLHATIRQAPVFGTLVANVANEAEVRAAPGVLDVAIIDGRHVAVVADSWWRAEQAAWLLDIAWAKTEADAMTSADMSKRLHAALDSDDPHEHLNEGDGEAVISGDAGSVVEATYDVPFVTHACMEPMNAAVIVRQDGSAEAWVPSQSPMAMRQGAQKGAGWAGVELTSVTCNVTMNGGAFGRRSDQDVVAQAAFLAARHRGRPVKLMWPREEDVARGLYRSHAAARLRAALGPDGLPVAYDALVAAQSIIQSVASRNMPFNPGPDGDRLTVEGLDKLHYAIPNRRMRSQHVPSHMPIHFWRSNGFSFNTFFTESFIDECALAAAADPLDYRRALLRDSPRHLAVLNRVAEMAGWSTAMAPGRGRGIAIEECYRSVVAQVAEVTVAEDGEIAVDRVFCAIDVGMVVNPDAVAAQMEGGIIFGLTTALMSAVTLEGGAVMESNFHDFPMLRIADVPDVVVDIVPSDLPPGGAGEPGIVPVAAALANAIHAATGRRLRSLPLALTETIGERRTRRILRT
ncbi:xanthine dehydrogenase family protein molybdopterin-binding subunit [Neorhizobium galegae]|uniref:xanthine dehydrogenase family protein molybdopterin-binding subunit n=1 Tax=Neorhizobium galegae TaxID=399 RepID=UPI0006226A6B|nr:molybdopterin cofactor-binding domain-containing protein [Neorhizobium galegae]KAB1125089.1 xanthine dehydrogenase family protein molybdopterin-binding subunit [Neorhizobium galegae]MCQ1809959.1 molybdopterin-dependent oxidoreductase [Neorhizobium galegae]CDZ61303.1 Isoquinoline 1-oxidoreductase, beta subunit [Neorhizobium galegae bv. orientalis]